jgi:plasmid stabilization system protein ParE
MTMNESLEQARETIEHSAHAASHASGNARNVAVLVAILAAALALAEMAEKGAQNQYLTDHITASDDWAFYQAKTLRSALYTEQAEVMASLPNAADPANVARIATARAEAKRMDDDETSLGRKQLMAKAQHSEHLRDHEFHRYHLFELAVSGLQIAIVLASVSVVTRVGALAMGSGLLGAAASVLGIVVALELL